MSRNEIPPIALDHLDYQEPLKNDDPRIVIFVIDYVFKLCLENRRERLIIDIHQVITLFEKDHAHYRYLCNYYS